MNEGQKNCEQSELILMDCLVHINDTVYQLAKNNKHGFHLLGDGGKVRAQVKVKESTTSKNYEGSGAVGPVRTVRKRRFLVMPARLLHPDMTGTFDIKYATKSRSYSRSTSDYGSLIGNREWQKRNFSIGERIELPDGKFAKVLIDANLKPGNGEIVTLLND